MTKEMMADRIAAMIAQEPLLASALYQGFESATIAAILMFGPRRDELAIMYDNVMLADSSRRINEA